jgi:hypothetical protein
MGRWTVTQSTDFALSRIYAKGWSAGRASDADPDAEDFAASVSALNPYRTGIERERWATGFQDGLRRSHGLSSRLVR